MPLPSPKKKVLLLGSTGKMGIALHNAFKDIYDVFGKNSEDFDAGSPKTVSPLIDNICPDIVVNTAALLGIDPCELEPEKALQMNTMFPKHLAELSEKKGFVLVHFSTDAVFPNIEEGAFAEDDSAYPLNLYGLTKFGGDSLIQSIASRHYIFRLPVLFGPSNKKNQFVEKMLERIQSGQKTLKVSADIISSPSYSNDIARESCRIIKTLMPFGLYHLNNEGQGSLYDLMKEIKNNLKINVRLEPASFRDFPHIGKKNVRTPMKSIRIKPLRPWKEAVKAYCREMRNFQA
jgi:dTDP-4-dehydrorhamnose reductase